MPQQHQYDGWSYERLQQQRNRAHFLLEDPHRFVTVILSTRPSEPKRLYCIDSPCYHASGPLGEGDLVEIEDMLCVRCPWHRYLVSLDQGKEIFLEPTDSKAAEGFVGRHSTLPTYPLQPLDPSGGDFEVVRGKRVQRVHAATLNEATGILTIEVMDEADMALRPVKSDKPAGSMNHGEMCMQIFDIKSKGLDRL